LRLFTDGRPLVSEVGRTGRAGLGEICGTLVAGETVDLSGLGTFIVRSKSEQSAAIPKQMPNDRRRVMVFKPSNILKAHVNGQISEEKAKPL
jgi:integration host factor subunit alpha